MNVYIATGRYSESHNGRCYKTIDWNNIVVSNTESEALGLLLEKHPDTTAGDWEIELIDTSKLSVDCVSCEIWEA